MSGAYYNEFDIDKAAWLRELIKAGVVADGEVDTRSIVDVSPEELLGFNQCHFFAGIGVWSYALRLAGWPDDKPVWTGSCPCPSFSAAGKGQGFDDPRHLWPVWSRLIGKRQPAAIFGEQADDAIGYGWLDLVQAELEASGYAVGKAVLGAASVGAPHIRQRLYFVAHADGGQSENRDVQRSREQRLFAQGGVAGGMADAAILRHDGWRTSEALRVTCEPEQLRHAGKLGYTASGGRRQGNANDLWSDERAAEEGADRRVAEPGPVNGFWRNADWIWCRDQKYRPVEPGTFPLAHGAPARILQLRGFGDAINPEVAAAFIRAAGVQ